MTTTTNEYGQQNIFAKEPKIVVEDYNRKGLFSPQQYTEMYNGRWAMMGVVSGFISYAITGNFLSARIVRARRSVCVRRGVGRHRC